MTKEIIDGYTVVERTEREVILEFGYDFSGFEGAVSELSIDDEEADLTGYRLQDGTYGIHESGRRGRIRRGYTREQAIKYLINHVNEWKALVERLKS